MKQCGAALLALTIFLVLAGAAVYLSCGPPPPRHAPLYVNKEFYLCCNMYYPATRFHDANYQYQNTFIPLGTKVKVLAMNEMEVRFMLSDSGRQLTWVKRYARVPLASLLAVWLLEEDPREIVNGFNPHVKELIYAGKIEPGMTKQQVIYALGFPPQHKTPDTSMDQWTYWNRNPYSVTFVLGRVVSVTK
jgi:hypothetical protein